MVPSNIRSNLSSKLGRFCKSKRKVEAETVKMLRAVWSAALSKSGPPRWPYFRIFRKYESMKNIFTADSKRFKRHNRSLVTEQYWTYLNILNRLFVHLFHQGPDSIYICKFDHGILKHLRAKGIPGTGKALSAGPPGFRPNSVHGGIEQLGLKQKPIPTKPFARGKPVSEQNTDHQWIRI